MNRRNFIKTVACLSATVAVPFKSILAASPVRGSQVALRLYWRAISNGVIRTWRSKALTINVDKNKGFVITGIGMTPEDLRLPKITDHIEFVLSRDAQREESMKDALVGDWVLYSIWAGERLMDADQMRHLTPGDPGPDSAIWQPTASGPNFRAFDDVAEEGVMFKMGGGEEVLLRLVSGARYAE